MDVLVLMLKLLKRVSVVSLSLSFSLSFLLQPGIIDIKGNHLVIEEEKQEIKGHLTTERDVRLNSEVLSFCSKGFLLRILL